MINYDELRAQSDALQEKIDELLEQQAPLLEQLQGHTIHCTDNISITLDKLANDNCRIEVKEQAIHGELRMSSYVLKDELLQLVTWIQDKYA